jgi:DnaK suppressor protein
MLEGRRQQLVEDLKERVRQVRQRAVSNDATEVVDTAESAEADIQDELHFSLMQMKGEMLEKIEEALIRLDSGNFGICTDCGDEIAERRLRALPFALRCKECEEEREVHARQARPVDRPFGGVLFDVAS